MGIKLNISKWLSVQIECSSINDFREAPSQARDRRYNVETLLVWARKFVKTEIVVFPMHTTASERALVMRYHLLWLFKKYSWAHGRNVNFCLFPTFIFP